MLTILHVKSSRHPAVPYTDCALNPSVHPLSGDYRGAFWFTMQRYEIFFIPPNFSSTFFV